MKKEKSRYMESRSSISKLKMNNEQWRIISAKRSNTKRSNIKSQASIKATKTKMLIKTKKAGMKLRDKEPQGKTTWGVATG